MINAEVVISKSLDVVWDFYINSRNWGKWWLQGIKRVVPGWEEDAVVHWSDDSECAVWNLVPREMVQLDSQWVRTTFRFSEINGETLVQVELVARWERNFDGRGALEKTKLLRALFRLKECVESAAIPLTTPKIGDIKH